jgi:TolB-like protein/class 3 adenylate cyclase/cytochrome c-type biogenesis protein CcmH/NrfG
MPSDPPTAAPSLPASIVLLVAKMESAQTPPFKDFFDSICHEWTFNNPAISIRAIPLDCKLFAFQLGAHFVSEDGVERRLTTILAADIVGYGRLMAADEAGTLAQLKTLHKEVVEPRAGAHHGRVFKDMGDGILMEFGSVVDAVNFAVDLQRTMADRNIDAPEDRQLIYRIGINIGDIVVEGDDIYGNGVIVASRLEALSEPGGIYLSRTVFDHVKGRVEIGFEDLGDQKLKNIPEPVRVYRALMGPGAENVKPLTFAKKLSLRRPVLVASFAFVLLGGLVIWNWLGPSVPDQVGLGGVVKSSIAVLPFTNLNEDLKDDYFSAGITNDIIIDLSKFENLMVIASNSTSGYQGRTVEVKDVSRELGVRYVLMGSVMKRDGRVRINTQLIDGGTGQNLWTDRYDESTDNIWDIQDKITGHIVSTLAIRITKIEQQRVLTQQTKNFDAYEYTLRGQALLAKQSRSENFESRKLFRHAIELDSNYAAAYSGLGWTYFEAVQWGWTGSPQQAVQQAYDLSQKALSLQATDISGRRLLASIYGLRRQHDLALIESERLIAINPNDAGGFAQQGRALTWLGRPDGAILALERSLLLDPDMKADFVWQLGLAYYLKERYADSVAMLERNIGRKTDPFWDYLLLAAVYGQMGRMEEAARVAKVVRQIDPLYNRLLRFGQFENVSDTEKVNEGLRKAGLL